MMIGCEKRKVRCRFSRDTPLCTGDNHMPTNDGQTPDEGGCTSEKTSNTGGTTLCARRRKRWPQRADQPPPDSVHKAEKILKYQNLVN